MQLLAGAFRAAPPGVVVAASDVLLLFPGDAAWDWTAPGVTGLGIPVDPSYGPKHGVFVPRRPDPVAEVSGRVPVPLVACSPQRGGTPHGQAHSVIMPE